MVVSNDFQVFPSRRSTASNVSDDGPSAPGHEELFKERTSALAAVKPPDRSRSPEVLKRAPQVVRLPDRVTGYPNFRRICDELVAAASRLDEYLQNDLIADEGLEVVVQVEHLLEVLYECKWGESESLKRIVVAIQSQVNNAKWTKQHVEFLKDIVLLVRGRYLIDPPFVNECMDLIAEHGLDEFRGIMSGEVVHRFRLEPVEDQ